LHATQCSRALFFSFSTSEKELVEANKPTCCSRQEVGSVLGALYSSAEVIKSLGEQLIFFFIGWNYLSFGFRGKLEELISLGNHLLIGRDRG
jgi:hypothetical protein